MNGWAGPPVQLLPWAALAERRRGGVLGVKTKNVSDNCLEMPRPDENHQFHLLVGSQPVRHTFPVPFSQKTDAPPESLLMPKMNGCKPSSSSCFAQNLLLTRGRGMTRVLGGNL